MIEVCYSMHTADSPFVLSTVITNISSSHKKCIRCPLVRVQHIPKICFDLEQLVSLLVALSLQLFDNHFIVLQREWSRASWPRGASPASN